jgi:rsbT co-antagonist protein RsbR
MWQRFFTWLDTTQITDPFQQHQARLVLRVLVVLLGAGVLSLPILFAQTGANQNLPLSLIALFVGFACYTIAIWQIRTGAFDRGVLIGLCGLITLVTLFALPTGILRNPIIGLSYVLPLVLSGLLLGSRTMIWLGVVCLTLMILLATAEYNGIIVSTSTGNLLTDMGTAVVSVTLMWSLICSVVALFWRAFRTTLHNVQLRSNELEQLRTSLEQTVQDRTASLALALSEMKVREQHLATTLVELQQSRETIRDLSAPILPVLPGVLVAPLIGSLNEERIAAFADHLLHEIERQHARHVILDITGVPLVDTQVAQTLLHTADSVRLLGATALLVGVRPEVAQTLVSLGIDLGRLPSFPDLREAVATLTLQRSATPA